MALYSKLVTHHWSGAVFIGLFLCLMSTSAFAKDPTLLISESQTCVACHKKEVNAWRSSHHAKAMGKANSKNILGNFEDARLSYEGKLVKFTLEAEKYYIEMPNLSGVMKKYQVLYTFGFDPLQQYMFDEGKGKLQFFPFAWDSRPKSMGGQRWYVVHPDQEPHDSFHWSRMGQNWNQMCADCHSSDFRKNFDLNTRTYSSEFSSINVSCSSCHGNLSEHSRDPVSYPVLTDSPYIGVETPLYKTDSQSKLNPISKRRSSDQVIVCASCHARRNAISDRAEPDFLNRALETVLLTPEFYHVDGQVSDENFVWGSFVQSKMYDAGVTCTNCHDPHGGQLHVTGNQVCTQCHDSKTYDKPTHHMHKVGTDAAECVSCHMPATVYMGVDSRRDHQFSIPRPHLTRDTGAPNACNNCHTNQDANWASTTIETWYPKIDDSYAKHFAYAFNEADNLIPSGRQKLLTVFTDDTQATIIRASALSRLANYPHPDSMQAIEIAVKRSEPQFRLAAIDAAAPYSNAEKWQLLKPLINDAQSNIRARGSRALAAASQMSSIPVQAKKLIKNGLEEYRSMQNYQADRGFAHTNLGNLERDLNNFENAAKHYNAAINIEPIYIPAYLALARLTESLNNTAQSINVLNQALTINPDSAEVYFALGLTRIRQRNKKLALAHLQKATELSPNNPHYFFTFGALLQDQGQAEEALKNYETAHKLAPKNPRMTYAVLPLLLELGQTQKALTYAEQLVDLIPEDLQTLRLINMLRKTSAKTN
ncbi:MAG: tetratricopeptide repeat protein [Oleiphilaceae bacterium]|nr:tetratricopeptide repeat protein [Oleiphilaceae bacterium]